MTKLVRYNAKPHQYMMRIVVLAAMWALPVVSGGLYNIAHWVAWGWAWVAVVFFTIGIFASKPKEIAQYPAWLEVVFYVLKWGGIAWLLYHGLPVIATMLAYGFCLAYLLRESSKRS